MIGRFWYADSPCIRHVAVRLEWRSGEPLGRVEPPPEVVGRLPFEVVLDDEFMVLAVALGYAVTIAAMAGIKLTITGDVSAWPSDWGALSPRPEASALTH